MNRSKLLANRFREVILDGKWIANTNFKDQLSTIDWTEATTKVGSLNTIALLAFHINYYIEGVLNVLEGGKLLIRDKYSFDAPPINSEDDWISLKERMWQNAEKFARLIEEKPDSSLEDAFVNPKYGSFQRNIDGIIEHSYYHLGQISLIKKLIQAQTSQG